MINHTPKKQIDARYYEDLKKHSPRFRKEFNLTKKELALGIAYYKFRELGGRVIAHQTDIFKMNLNKIELAYWKYHLTNERINKLKGE